VLPLTLTAHRLDIRCAQIIEEGFGGSPFGIANRTQCRGCRGQRRWGVHYRERDCYGSYTPVNLFISNVQRNISSYRDNYLTTDVLHRAMWTYPSTELPYYILGDEALVAMTDYKYDSASYDEL
jgi:hypothetical protein